MGTIVPNAENLIGFLFVGMRLFRIIAPGIVRSVEPVGTGESGIALNVTDARMELASHVNFAVVPKFRCSSYMFPRSRCRPG